MRFKKIVNLFENGGVSVSGMKGTGKDTLMGNVIARRKQPYVSNLDYGGQFWRLYCSKLNINNTYHNFINYDTNYYNYIYPIGADIYISDAGVYFPSQYCNQLNRDYEGIVGFQALSRQLAMCNVHFNAQNLNRVWDKIREQSDTYIRCRKCWHFFGFVLQFITIYDKYESCLARVSPCRISVPLLGDKVAKMQARLYLDNFFNVHGKVENKVLFYRNKSKHDTHYFGHLLGSLKQDESPKKK